MDFSIDNANANKDAGRSWKLMRRIGRMGRKGRKNSVRHVKREDLYFCGPKVGLKLRWCKSCKGERTLTARGRYTLIPRWVVQGSRGDAFQMRCWKPYSR